MSDTSPEAQAVLKMLRERFPSAEFSIKGGSVLFHAGASSPLLNVAVMRFVSSINRVIKEKAP